MSDPERPHGTFEPPPDPNGASATFAPPPARTIPPLFAVFLGLMLLSAAWAALFGSPATGALEVAVLLGLATRSRWARWLAMIMAGLTLFAVGIVLSAEARELGGRAIVLAAVGVANAGWIYVLCREDTLAFFARRSRK